jgi:predicted dehydrogenase
MKNKENIRLAFVGAGNIAEQHMRYLEKFPDVDIVGLYDTNEEVLQIRQRQFGGKKYRSINRMLKVLEPDAVFICLPPYAHNEAEIVCVEHHIPFLVEKPLSNDITTAKKVVDEVRASRIITCAAYMNRYRRGVQEAKRLLEKYPVSLVNGGWLLDTPVGHSWLTQKKLSGGQLVEQTTHLFDLVRYLCGEVSSIHCYGSKGFVHPTDIYDVEDTTVVSIQLKSGAVACIQSSWSTGFKSDIYLKLLGPDIHIEFNNWDFDAKMVSRDGSVPLEIPGEKDILAIEGRAFLDAVKSNDPSGILSDYEDGVRSLELSFAANKSLETRRPIHLIDNW